MSKVLVVKKAAPNKRGSPEAIAKRRAARAFNDLLDPSGRTGLDGRTEKRRQRLLSELGSGKTRGSGKALKPIDILSHVTELLELGESIASIRKACRPRPAVAPDPRLLETLARLHRAYGFPPEAYAFLGIGDEALRRAGIVGGRGRRTAAPPAGDEPPPQKTRRRRGDA
jgi:hypothetical protein